VFLGSFMLKKLSVIVGLALSSSVFAGGVSPYLPLKQDPQLEQLVEKLLVVGDNAHILTKPYKADEILRVLKTIEHSYPSLHKKLFNQLAAYRQGDSVTFARATLAYGNNDKPIPNQRGQKVNTNLKLEGGGYANFSDYFGISVAGIVNEDDILPTQTMMYFGNEYAQVDIGYREHWYSPFNDSAMIMSTNAKALPSISISNVTPITDFAIRYDFFYTQMKEDPKIDSGEVFGEFVPGKPHLAGFQLSFAPTDNLTLGVNRILQFGGGDRSVSFKDFAEAFFLPGNNDNVNRDEIEEFGPNYEVGDQLAAINFDYRNTLFDNPFSFYGEVGLEDTLGGTRNNAYHFGLYLPFVTENQTLRLENSRWQTEWYWSKLYSQGNTIDKNAIGHWGGDQRYFQHYPSAESQSVNWSWDLSAAQNLETTFRRIETEMDSNGKIGAADAPYTIGFEVESRYTQQLESAYWGLELYTGKSVFDENFIRIGAFYGW